MHITITSPNGVNQSSQATWVKEALIASGISEDNITISTTGVTHNADITDPMEVMAEVLDNNSKRHETCSPLKKDNIKSLYFIESNAAVLDVCIYGTDYIPYIEDICVLKDTLHIHVYPLMTHVANAGIFDQIRDMTKCQILLRDQSARMRMYGIRLVEEGHIVASIHPKFTLAETVSEIGKVVKNFVEGHEPPTPK